jgi:Mg-chelatase subunit ChlD
MPRRTTALALTLVSLLALILAGCGGGSTTQVFSEINSGLGPDAAREGAPTTAAAAMAPTAAPAVAATSAPAATAAPAAEMAPPASLPAADGAGSAAGAAPELLPAPTAAAAAGGERERPLGQEASLKAGEVDDNGRFADYLAYLEGYGGGGVRPADVSERYLIKVMDERQRPVLDARVSVYDGERLLFQGRTYAGGATIFMPRLFDSANAAAFRAVAEYGQARAETTFARGAGAQVELGLRGVSPDEALRLDLLFLLDTTGSMDDELARIQETIDSIAARIDAFTPRPDIRYGLVAYRDEGDEYVTRSAPFTGDVAAFRTELARLRAYGGGDTPEAVDAALYEAVVRAGWRDQPAVRLVFLVGDAGPHINGQSQFTYLDATREAVARGVKIYPIAASSTDAPAEYVFRQLAQQTLAGFIFLTYQPGASGGAPGESTPLEAGEQPYTVARLDDLIVGVVERELAAAVGAR